MTYPRVRSRYETTSVLRINRFRVSPLISRGSSMLLGRVHTLEKED